MLGTTDAWLTIHLSQQTNEPAYYILDCRILDSEHEELAKKKNK